MSSERVIVPKSMYNDLVAEFQKVWANVPATPRALFSLASASRVRDLIADAQSKGATDILSVPTSPAASTSASSDPDAYINPLILGPVDRKMRLHTEESFGPLCVLVPVPDEGKSEEALIDDMVTEANDTEYGLSAAVWGKDIARAEAVARRIESGAVHINAPTAQDAPQIPHGGWKSSGWGRFNSVEGIRSFTQMRSIEVPREPAQGMPLAVFDL